MGPLLFLLHINDVVDIFKSPVKTKLFADDIKLYVEISTGDDQSLLQTSLLLLE